MTRFRHTVAWALAGAAFAVLLLVGVVLWLTRTQAGVERAGRYVVERLQGAVNGELEVTAVRSRGLLRGVTLVGVRINGPDGRLFLRADSARLAYDIRTLLAGDIAFRGLTLYRPEIHVERLPGAEKWNYQIIFPDDPDDIDEVDDENLVLIENATLHDGFIAVRMPWQPSGPVTAADTARLILEQVPGGLVRTVRFEQVNARLPQILWQAPEAEGRVIRIGEMSAHAYIWETAADIRELEGTLTLRDSIIAFRAPHVRLPGSELSALGQVVLGQELRRYDIEAQGDRLAFRDFQWLYPALPEDGGGSLRFRVQSQERGNILWLATDAMVRTAGTELAGSFGVVTGDTLYFANVAVRASPLDMELVRRLLPVDLPVEGLLLGTVEIEGPISALRTRGDLRNRSEVAGRPAESAVRWSGVIRAQQPYGVQGLDAEVRRLDLAHVAAVEPGLRLGGVVTGRVRASGTTLRGFDVSGHLALDHYGALSTVRGGGRFLAANGHSELDLRLDAEPVALSLLSAQYPAFSRLVGQASGPVRLAGSLEDLRVGADLRAPVGMVHLDGRLELTDKGARYVTRGTLDGFRLDHVVAGLPETRLTGQFELEGGGGLLRELDGRFAVRLTRGEVAGVEIQSGSIHGRVVDGLARVDSATVTGPIGQAHAAGTLGLAAERHGALRFALTAGSLAPLEAVLFDQVQAEEDVLAGPLVDGSVTVEGVLSGSVSRWAVQARVSGRDVVYRDLTFAAAAADLDWGPAGGTLEARLDSLRVGHRLLPALRAAATQADGAGTVRLWADGPGAQTLEVESRFARLDRAVQVFLDHAVLDTGTGRWQLRDPVAARVGPHGLDLGRLVLDRTPGGAAVRMAGILPWRHDDGAGHDEASLAVDVSGIPIGEVVALLQLDHPMDGTLTAGLTVSGTALSPVLEGNLSARPFRYEDAVLDSLGGRLDYRDRLLTGSLVGWRAGRAIVAADATVPVELALTEREERLLEGRLHLGLRADGMPAGLVAFLVPGLWQVEGTMDGAMTLSRVQGNGARSVLEGELRLTGGSALVEPLNVRYREATAVARMGGGSVMMVELRLRSDQGTATVLGSLDLDTPSDPTLDLRVSARRLDAARRRDVTAVADAEVQLRGRYTRPVIAGNLRLISGEMNLDEVLRQHQIVQLDTSLFQIFDAGSITYRIQPANPFIKNLALSGLVITADRNFWLRSQELNVEVAGSLDVSLDRQYNDIRLTGTMAALRGSYQLQVLERVPTRRFEIREGTIDFPGTPGIDPNLNISAGYRVRRAQGDPLDVVATVTGTLQSPRVRLTSDSDPPVSETDIASFLLFGRSTLELSQAESDVVASMREGMLGLARPIFLGLAATQLQQAAANLGLPVDYLALTAPEYGFGDYSQVMSAHGGLGVLQGTQLEAGAYLHRDIFVLGSFTPFARALGPFTDSEPLFHPRWGARVEWRFRPTWTMEVYWEDRFARTPSFSYDQIHDRTVGGLSVFREWGY
jgi:hypothetical protein